jgi:transporter family protein
MERWVGYAFISMIFAGVTAVIAKQGLEGISGELGIAVRTLYVALFIAFFSVLAIAPGEWKSLQRSNLLWLGLSAATTAVSWVYYYRALKLGDVATVALIDKGSTVIAIVLAWLMLKEAITLRLLLGAALIMAGLLVISRK